MNTVRRALQSLAKAITSDNFLGRNLIFLISQPRAGSTMLQKVLAGHPQIHTVSEPWIALHPLFGLRDHGIAGDYDPEICRKAVEEFLRYLPEGEEAYWEGARRMLSYLYSRALAGSGKRIFLDKTPRYYFVIPELRRVFPRARFVFLVRNPVAVLASVLDTWVKNDDAAQLRHSRHDLMTAPPLILEGIRSFGTAAIIARYEELTATPENAVRRLCERLGISFYPTMIEYGAAGANQKRWMYGDQGTVYKQSRPVAERADHWRLILKQSAVWKAWAHGYITALGPALVRDLGYNYEELVAEVSVPEEGVDWAAVMRVPAG